MQSALPEPLQWAEGMLLSPQHFQQNDIYWHEQLAHRVRCSRPYAWGLWDLKVDEKKLLNGILRIHHVEAILPDGLPVQFPASSDDQLSDYNFAAHPSLKGLNGYLTLHLVVAKRMRGAASEHSDLRRYRPIPGGTALDENTGSGEIELDRLRACLMILPEDQLTGGHEHIPLLRIKRQGKGFRLTSYHPPLLRARGANFLGKHAILEHLDSMLRKIVKHASGQSGDAEGQRLVYALTAAMPALDIMVQSGETHPFDLYLGLANLLGQIAQIAPSPLSTMNTLAYQHNDIYPGFYEMLSVINQLIGDVHVGHQTTGFTRISQGVFEIELKADWDLDDLYVEVRGKDTTGLENWMRDTHIGQSPLHAQLRRRRLPGAGRKIARDDLSRRLPVAKGAVLFSLINGYQDDANGQPQALLKSNTLLRIAGPEPSCPEALVLYFRTGKPAHKTQSNTVSGDESS